MKLSIIIPVYNEEKTIAEILKRVLAVKLPQDLEKEVLVVDDGSTDNTRLILKKIKYKNLRVFYQQKNMGKGAAVRCGINNSSGDVIIIQDADLEYDPNDYQKLLKPIVKKKEKVVYGSRLMNYPLQIWGENRTPLPTHWLGNKFLTIITNMVYQSNLTDMETCYKVLTREVVDKLVLKSDRFDIEPEITAKIFKRGYRILEVPIKVSPRSYNEGKKISWKDGFSAVWALLKYRFFD